MQKVEGSNPFSRSLKGLHLQVFFVNAVGWCVCIAPDRNRNRPARQRVQQGRCVQVIVGTARSNS